MKNDDVQKADQENVFNSKYHTLIVQEHPEERRFLGGSSIAIIPAYTEYRLYVNEFAEDERGLHILLDRIRQSQNEQDELTIRISSFGGYTTEGKVLQNLINDKFIGRTRTILDSHGYSMGALVFCMGDERIVYENSDLMFHTYSTFLYGKSGDIDTQHRYNEQSLRSFFWDLVVEPGFLSEDEFEAMMIGRDFWMGAVEMCQRGIATHVKIGPHKILAEYYLAVISNEMSIQKAIKKSYKKEHSQSELGKALSKKKKSKKAKKQKAKKQKETLNEETQDDKQ